MSIHINNIQLIINKIFNMLVEFQYIHICCSKCIDFNGNTRHQKNNAYLHVNIMFSIQEVTQVTKYDKKSATKNVIYCLNSPSPSNFQLQSLMQYASKL